MTPQEWKEPLESPETRRAQVDKFSLILGAVAALLAALPAFLGWFSTPDGALHLQQQTALDDQMVYAAWMQQAMQGRFLFENLFAVDPQPGLTFHLYFLLLGQVARVVGVVAALSLARVGFSFLFVFLLGRFLTRMNLSSWQCRSALAVSVFGGGLGAFAWAAYGREILSSSPVRMLTGGWLPIDVWQPEAFVFPSMLTNGLFMASLCLFLVIFRSVLDAQESWKPVPLGAGAFLVLMNIHSYDVLLLALVLAGFLVTQIKTRMATGAWIARVAVIGAGALPSAAWFLHVLSQDKVFQLRAATLTYSPLFGQVIAGIFPLAVLSLLFKWLKTPKDSAGRGMVLAAAGVLVAGVLFSFGRSPDGYWMSMPLWAVAFAGVLALLWFWEEDDQAKALLWSWALVGLVAIYFPGLFQRKLAMGMILPWGILVGWEAVAWFRSWDHSRRILIGILGAAVVSASSLMWLVREMAFVQGQSSSTTLHSPLLAPDAKLALDALAKEPGRVVAVAPPGIPYPDPQAKGNFLSPALPDLNPMISGLAGKFAYAGHWSETPEYSARREAAQKFFSSASSPEDRQGIIARGGLTHVLAPTPGEGLPFPDLTALGETVYQGKSWSLIRLTK
jgi:hypothetical protein